MHISVVIRWRCKDATVWSQGVGLGLCSTAPVHYAAWLLPMPRRRCTLLLLLLLLLLPPLLPPLLLYCRWRQR